MLTWIISKENESMDGPYSSVFIYSGFAVI